MKIPANINKRFGPRSKKEMKRRAVAWDRKLLQFLESKPVCSACGDELHHFSYTMLCDICRPKRNYRRFVSLNPLYSAQRWQRDKERLIIAQRKRRLTKNMDEINRRRRIRRREKRKNYEDSLRFKLGRLEKEVRASGLINQALK